MSLNLFYFSPISRKTVSFEFSSDRDIDDLQKIVSAKESIPENHFKLYSNGKPLKSTEELTNDLVICLHFGLNGGKGGFGSMLRAIGAQIEKTTNREACRDLSGRRLRDINEEKRIKEWIKKENQRKDEMEERRRQKLERMAQQPKTEFNDLDFERTRSEIPDIVDEALQYGLQVQQSSSSGQTDAQKRKLEQSDQKIKPKKKKKLSLWIADDIEVEDSDESEIETNDSTEDQSTSNENTNDTEITNKIEEKLSASEAKFGESTASKDTNDEALSREAKEENKEILIKQKESTETMANDKQSSETSDSVDNKNEVKAEDKVQEWEPLNLMEYESVQQLESLGLDRLKNALIALGMKCGGSLTERANRLWSVRGLDVKDIPKKLLAKKK